MKDKIRGAFLDNFKRKEKQGNYQICEAINGRKKGSICAFSDSGLRCFESNFYRFLQVPTRSLG